MHWNGTYFQSAIIDDRAFRKFKTAVSLLKYCGLALGANKKHINYVKHHFNTPFYIKPLIQCCSLLCVNRPPSLFWRKNNTDRYCKLLFAWERACSCAVLMINQSHLVQHESWRTRIYAWIWHSKSLTFMYLSYQLGIGRLLVFYKLVGNDSSNHSPNIILDLCTWLLLYQICLWNRLVRHHWNRHKRLFVEIEDDQGGEQLKMGVGPQK